MLNEAGARAAGIKAFLFKPVSLDALIRTAREVLDGQNCQPKANQAI
jgi:hypothetical protein